MKRYAAVNLLQVLVIDNEQEGVVIEMTLNGKAVGVPYDNPGEALAVLMLWLHERRSGGMNGPVLVCCACTDAPFRAALCDSLHNFGFEYRLSTQTLQDNREARRLRAC